MPRCCSMSIQSLRALRRPSRACTEPATCTAPEYSRNFSVSVVLPASGWLMMANVRRHAASLTTSRPMNDRGYRRHMADYLVLTLDVTDLDTQTAFWTQALGYRVDGGVGQYRALVDEAGTGPKLLLQ